MYPQGIPPAPGQQSLRTWNADKCCGPAKRTNADDVRFTLAVLDDLARRAPTSGPSEQGQPGSGDEGETATKITYAPCKQAAEVVLWKLTGSGHVWPGTPVDVSGTPRGAVLGEPTKIVDANELMWAFFPDHLEPKP